jgi:WD40 repeat protein
MAAGPSRLFVTPSCKKYFRWGFPDGTLRCFATEGHRLLGIYEQPHDGEIVCGVLSDDGKHLALGGDDGAVTVWDVVKIRQSRRLELRERLCGHVGPVTAIAISLPYSICVSGSEDGSCIIWDLNRLSYVRQLIPPFEAPPSQIVINDITGDIAIASSTWVRVFSVNGDFLLAKSLSSQSPISSLVVSYGPEWCDQNVIVSGHRDGTIKLWSVTSDVLSAAATKKVGASSASANPSPDEPVPPPTSTPIAFDLVLRAHRAGQHRGPVTALSISADQQKLYSADYYGMVCVWSVPSEGVYDHWIKDNEVEACSSCKTKFTTLNRRHHCRNCGRIVCGACSPNRMEIVELGHLKPVRVCNDCYELQEALKAQS